MKIPRYSGTDVNISSGRSLTTGIGSSQGLVEIGKTALNAVTQYANAKTNYDAKMRRLEINTNVDLSTAQFGGNNQMYVDSLLSRDDYLTPDNWLKEYEDNFKKQELNYKKQLDEQTFKEFMPTFYENYFTTKSTIVNKIANQKVINAQIALDGENDLYKSKLENAQSLKQIKGLYDLHSNLTLKKGVTTQLYNDETYRKLVDDTKDYTNNKYIMFQVMQGAETMSPDGEKVIDHQQIYKNLRNNAFEIKDIDGNILSPDDDLRKALIKDYKTKRDNQIAVFKDQKDKKDDTTMLDFTNTLLGMEAGNKEDIKKGETFLLDLKNSDLDDNDKRTLKSAYTTTISNLASGKKSYDSPQGLQMKALLTNFVLSGAIDTHKERMIIQDMIGKGYIKPEYGTKLHKLSIEFTKDKNAYKKDLVKSATRLLLKEVGVNTKGDQIANVLSITNPEERTSALLGLIGSDALTQEAYNAVNNMNELIAQGERNGFSYENMLTNPRSPNYILQDVIDVYKSKINDASFKDLEGRIMGMRNTMKTTMQGEVEAFKTYYIMPSEYFTAKVPAMANIEVPPRNENETISAYINRVQGLIKENNSLPSVITGDAIETLDVSDLFVTDE